MGVTGARTTLGHGQTRTTVGLPGTGLSHTTLQNHAAEHDSAVATSKKAAWLEIVTVIGSVFVVAVGVLLAIFAALASSKSSTRRRR